MNRLFVWICLLLVAFAAADMVPFVIPVDIAPDSEIAMSYQPLTQADRLIAKDHFVMISGSPVRL